MTDDSGVPGMADAKALAPPSGRAERTASAASREVAARRGNSPATNDRSLIIDSIGLREYSPGRAQCYRMDTFGAATTSTPSPPVIAVSRHWPHLYHDRHGPPDDVPTPTGCPAFLDTAIICGSVSASSSWLREGGARSSTPLSVSTPLVTQTREPPLSCWEHSSAPRRTRRARGPAGPPAPLGPPRIRRCAAHPCSS